jgi:hypothetical protein
VSGPKSLDEAWTAFEAKNPDWENDKKSPLDVAYRGARESIGINESESNQVRRRI